MEQNIAERSLFGASAATGSGLFGGGAATSEASGGLFGGGSGLFGGGAATPEASSGLFGGGSGLFGGGGGLFGGGAVSSAVAGGGSGLFGGGGSSALFGGGSTSGGNRDDNEPWELSGPDQLVVETKELSNPIVHHYEALAVNGGGEAAESDEDYDDDEDDEDDEGPPGHDNLDVYTWFRVDNTELRSERKGLAYRRRRSLDGPRTGRFVWRDIKLAKWGSTIRGLKQSDGWVAVVVDRKYLPSEIRGKTVLIPIEVDPLEHGYIRNAVSQIKASITDKQNWLAKVFSASMVEKWRDEAKQQGAPMDAFEIAINELKDNRYFQNNGIASRDRFLPSVLKAVLTERLDALAQKCGDVHPDSNGIVQDLIHPSLYHYVHGESWPPQEDPKLRAVASPGVEDYALHRNEVSSNRFAHCLVGVSEWSRHQWLPTEVDVDANGSCSFASYVNNSPDDMELTLALEKTLSMVLPMFEEVTTAPGMRRQVCLRDRRLQIIIKAANYVISPGQVYEGSWHVEGMLHERIVASSIVYYDSSANVLCEGLSFRRLLNRNFMGTKRMPLVDWQGDFTPPADWTHRPEVEDLEFFSASKSGSSDYEGGKRRTEHKTEPGERLEVPTGFMKPRYKFSGDSNRVQGLGQLRSSESFPNNIDVGVVGTPVDRCLVFKNSLQHRVEPICNTSDTEKATRKILVFWLIDPDRRVPSTADVPRQQWDKIRPLLARTLHEQWRPSKAHPSLRCFSLRKNGREVGLGAALVKRILDYAKWGFTFKEASAQRLKLMAERKYSTVEVNSEFEKRLKREYSFCEH